MRNRSWGRLAVVGLACAACAGRAAGPTGVVAVTSVDPNPAHEPLGAITAVAELGDAVVVFGDEGVTVLLGGAVRASDHSVVSWRSAATIPAPDGAGDWVVGVDAHGRVQRVRELTSLEDVSDRLGLGGGDSVETVVAAGNGVVGFGLEAGIGWTAGPLLSRLARAPYRMFAAGAGRIAGLVDDRVELWEPHAGTLITYRVSGGRFLAFDGDGRLLVATAHTLYRQTSAGRGDLDPRWTLGDSSEIRGLAASGVRVWLAVGAELLVLDGSTLSRARDVNLPAGARLAGAAHGAVWVIAGDRIARYAVDDLAPTARHQWDTTIAPVFGRVCSRCHRPGGPADVDLSTYETWADHKGAIRRRVLVTRTMPPAGVILSDEDRTAIADWLK